MKEVFEKVTFEKKSADKKASRFTQHAFLKLIVNNCLAEVNLKAIIAKFSWLFSSQESCSLTG